MISVTRVDFRAQIWLLSWQIQENCHRHACTQHIRPPHPVQWGQALFCLIIVSLSNRWWGFPRMSSVSLASVQRWSTGPGECRLATCPIYKWAVLSLTSSKLKMSCLHLVRVQFSFQKGSRSLLLQRGRADKCNRPYVLLGTPRKLCRRDASIFNHQYIALNL